MPVELPVEVPKSPRTPRPRPMPTQGGPKLKKDKQKMEPLVRASPRKHPQLGKPTAQEKAKMVDLELEEEVEEISMDDEDITMETKDVEIEGSDPISKLPE